MLYVYVMFADEWSERERDGVEELMIYLSFVIWCWQVAYIQIMSVGFTWEFLPES